MKAICATLIGMLAFLTSGCITKDEITSVVIDPDGAVTFSIYRLNITSDQKGEDGKREFADYIRGLEEKKDTDFANLVKVNAKDVNVTILRKAAPASVLITARIPSLKDLAAGLSDDDFQCTAISTERTRGIRCEYIIQPSKGKGLPEPAKPRANSFSEIRVALAEGTIVKAKGFSVAQDNRSALVDMETLEKMDNWEVPSVPILLEWQIP
jgi:hypothetical protein